MALSVLRCSALVTFTATISKHTNGPLLYHLPVWMQTYQRQHCSKIFVRLIQPWLDLSHSLTFHRASFPIETSPILLKTGGGREAGSTGKGETGGKPFRVVGTIQKCYFGKSYFNILPTFMHRENFSNYGAGSNLTELRVETKIGIRINRKYFHSTLCMPGTSHVLTHILRLLWSWSHFTDEETKVQRGEATCPQGHTASSWQSQNLNPDHSLNYSATAAPVTIMGMIILLILIIMIILINMDTQC